MKIKTSVSLSEEVLAELRICASEGSRSEYIEKALWRYLELSHREARDARDLTLINATAARLNREALDSLGFQAPL